MSPEKFLRRLSAYSSTEIVHNFYRGRSQAAQRARQNLTAWLQDLERRRPAWAMVGEAPGYKGGALTGLPFSSEYLLHAGVSLSSGEQIWGQPYVIQQRQPPQKEATARMIWEVLALYGEVPLLWNAFPFHPHRAGEPQSNRRPSAAEQREGLIFLTLLLKMYEIQTVVAVGQVAHTLCERHLTQMQVYKVRHPSFGGKRDFTAGMRVLFQTGKLTSSGR